MTSDQVLATPLGQQNTKGYQLDYLAACPCGNLAMTEITKH